MEIQGLLIMPITVGFCVASPLMVHILLGNQWSAAIPIAQLLFVGIFARLGAMVLETAALTLGYAWGSARRQFVSAGILVIGLTFAASWSSLWVAVVVSASRVVNYILGLRFGIRTFNMAPAPIVFANLKGAVVAFIGASVSLGGIMLLNTSIHVVEDIALPIFYWITVMLLILFGPARLVDPVGSLGLELMRKFSRRWLGLRS